jgi:hypothetical protein
MPTLEFQYQRSQVFILDVLPEVFKSVGHPVIRIAGRLVHAVSQDVIDFVRTKNILVERLRNTMGLLNKLNAFVLLESRALFFA